MVEKKVNVIVRAIIENNEKILLVKRNQPPHKDK